MKKDILNGLVCRQKVIKFFYLTLIWIIKCDSCKPRNDFNGKIVIRLDDVLNFVWKHISSHSKVWNYFWNDNALACQLEITTKWNVVCPSSLKVSIFIQS